MKFFCIRKTILASFCLFLFACTDESSIVYSSFEEWLSSNSGKSETVCNPKEKSVIFTSDQLKIEGLAKSMTGDLDEQNGSVDWSTSELIWLTGASVSVDSDDESLKETSDKHLCHSLVNYQNPKKLPWKIKTQGTDKRIFTFSQGVTKVQFPQDYGIPIISNSKLSIGNQVLNLEEPNLKGKVKFEVELNYINQQENCKPLKALYQQPVFVTKRTGGPIGAYNEKDTGKTESMDSSSTIFCDTGFAQCAISYEEGFNPYRDNFGRVFTGHWTISTDSLEVLATNITPMLDLQENTAIHAISLHVHPYAHSLELIDKTVGISLFKGTVDYQNGNLLRISNMDIYSSEEGIPVYKDHEYQLISIYQNPNGEEGITAMATMFLYLAE